jgi:hypothetical protein
VSKQFTRNQARRSKPQPRVRLTRGSRSPGRAEKRLAAGEKPETLDTWQIVSTPSGKQFRYAKALPVQQLCLTCHGDPASIPDGVKARLAAEYPLDKATGYAPGMVRGIVSIKRAL